MKLTEKELSVYSSYRGSWIRGGGFLSPQRCYEILNEGRTTNNRSSYKEHYYKIKW